MRLEGRTALVTGAAQGVGRGIATALAEAGARVAVTDVDLEGARACAQALEARGARVCALRLDVTRPQEIEMALDAAAAALGPVSLLVNNAGSTARQPFLEMEHDYWRGLVELNLTGTFLCAQAAARRMAEAAKGGSIVNISSNSGLFGGAGRACYSATKAGIIAFTQSLAIELAPHGIRVNCVAPGPIRTERSTTDEPDAVFTDRMALPRFGEPEEVGRAVAFLASDASSFTTGHVLGVDGGLTVTGIMRG